MKRDKYLKQEFSTLNDFLGLVEAYEEIAAIRMRKVKKSVLSRREYMQGLNDAFAYVVYAYKSYKSFLEKKFKKQLADQHVLSTNGKNVAVFVSSNTGLYGDIIRKTFDIFVNDKLEPNTDVVVIGRLGKVLYETVYPGREFTYFDMSDRGLDEENIKKMLDFIINYANVTIYHGVFKSILTQDAEKTQLTGEVMKIADSLKSTDIQFLFEPSVEKIAEYFEKQILGLLFEQSMFESSLSKFASRMVSLDSAAENINSKLYSLNFDLKKGKHKKINSGIQANLAGGVLWN